MVPISGTTEGEKSEPASTKFFSQSSALRTSNATATMSIHRNIAIENPNGKYKESKHSFQSDYLRNKTCIVHIIQKQTGTAPP